MPIPTSNPFDCLDIIDPCQTSTATSPGPIPQYLVDVSYDHVPGPSTFTSLPNFSIPAPTLTSTSDVISSPDQTATPSQPMQTT